MLPFGVTIPATVPQGSEILEGLMNNPVYSVLYPLTHQIDRHTDTHVSYFQLNAQFLYSITTYMLHYNPRHVSSSTTLIFRRSDCIITASGIVTLGRTVCQLKADCSPISTSIPYGRLQRVTIPDAVIIQFDLLKMSVVLLETCWGL